jgi:hypothetical protein
MIHFRKKYNFPNHTVFAVVCPQLLLCPVCRSISLQLTIRDLWCPGKVDPAKTDGVVPDDVLGPLVKVNNWLNILRLYLKVPQSTVDSSFFSIVNVIYHLCVAGVHSSCLVFFVEYFIFALTDSGPWQLYREQGRICEISGFRGWNQLQVRLFCA